MSSVSEQVRELEAKVIRLEAEIIRLRAENARLESQGAGGFAAPPPAIPRAPAFIPPMPNPHTPPGTIPDFDPRLLFGIPPEGPTPRIVPSFPGFGGSRPRGGFGGTRPRGSFGGARPRGGFGHGGGPFHHGSLP